MTKENKDLDYPVEIKVGGEVFEAGPEMDPQDMIRMIQLFEHYGILMTKVAEDAGIIDKDDISLSQ